jgi:hypothetical protein
MFHSTNDVIDFCTKLEKKEEQIFTFDFSRPKELGINIFLDLSKKKEVQLLELLNPDHYFCGTKLTIVSITPSNGPETGKISLIEEEKNFLKISLIIKEYATLKGDFRVPLELIQ